MNDRLKMSFLRNILLGLLLLASAVIAQESEASAEETHHPASLLARQQRKYNDKNDANNVYYYETENSSRNEDEEDDYANDISDTHFPKSSSRGLVPQLWPNYTGPAEPPAEEVPCDMAKLKCAYRAGCGLALQNYMLGCSDLAEGKTKTCNTHCRHSLIALMSTPEGQRLMKVRSEGKEKSRFETKSKCLACFKLSQPWVQNEVVHVAFIIGPVSCDKRISVVQSLQCYTLGILSVLKTMI